MLQYATPRRICLSAIEVRILLITHGGYSAVGCQAGPTAVEDEQQIRPAVLWRPDGWGMSDNTDHNAISAAKTGLGRLWAAILHDPHLPVRRTYGGQMGNSEVSHLNLSAGRYRHPGIVHMDKAARCHHHFFAAATDAYSISLRNDSAVRLASLSPGIAC